jgi:hypothetical protein
VFCEAQVKISIHKETKENFDYVLCIPSVETLLDCEFTIFSKFKARQCVYMRFYIDKKLHRRFVYELYC